jgi:hypothetical protein
VRARTDVSTLAPQFADAYRLSQNNKYLTPLHNRQLATLATMEVAVLADAIGAEQ